MIDTVALDFELQWGHALSGMDIRIDERTKQEGQRRFNGAMPFQAWISSLSACIPAAQSCFNGAMPFQAWIYWAAVQSLRKSECFNGAMPFQAWICSSASWISSLQKRLQWGHALSGMDMLQKGAWMETVWVASMGPCPFRHGYVACQCGVLKNNCASMGPCPFRHGYAGVCVGRWPTLDCFNGAMPFQAWISAATSRRGRQGDCFNGAMPFQAWICLLCKANCHAM